MRATLNHTTVLLRQQRGAAFTSSYDEEKAAMRFAIEWLLPSLEAAAICIDCQSHLWAIQCGSADTSDLRRMLDHRTNITTLLWISDHYVILGYAVVEACA